MILEEQLWSSLKNQERHCYLGTSSILRSMSLGPGLKAAEIKRQMWEELRVARGACVFCRNSTFKRIVNHRVVACREITLTTTARLLSK